MRGKTGSAAAPAAICKKVRRASFTAFPATRSRASILVELDLFGKPASTFPDHALVQRLALDGAAAQRPALFARPISAGVQAGEVVPHHEVARSPDVLVDDCRILGDREQLLQ